MNYLDKPCNVCHGPEEDLTHIDDIFNHPHIETPYQMLIIRNTNVGFWWENQKINYIPYDFFVLKTRLRPFVPITYDIDFASYQYKDRMIWLVEFHSTSKVKLSQNDANQYQDLVDEFVKEEHCELILDYKHDWYLSILPFLEIDQQYDPMITNKILINLHSDRYYHDESIKGSERTHYYYDYLDVYLQLQKQLLKKLNQMYKKGVVVADPVIDKDVIDEWQLVINYQGLYTTTNIYDFDITDRLMHALLK